MAENRSRLMNGRHLSIRIGVQLCALAVLLGGVSFLAASTVQASGQIPAATTIPGAWTAAANTPDYGAQLVLLRDGRVLDTNLQTIGTNPTIAYIYDPSTNTWGTTASLTQTISWNSAVEMSDGSVMIMGGLSPCSTVACYQASTYLYNPSTNAWSSTAPMSTARDSASATLLRNGKVLVAGGNNSDSGIGLAYLTSAELYDPTTRQWSSAGNMTFSRAGHTAVLLNDGRVLVVGGEGVPPAGTSKGFSGCGVVCPQFVATPEIYDPATNHWTTAAPIPNSYQQFAVTVLPTGKVLFTGAWDGSSPTSDYSTNLLYDPVANTWSTAAPMLHPRRGQVVALLPTGNVLVEGGESAQSAEDLSAEEYNPFTNTWTATASISGYRAHTEGSAIVLADGRVLVNGGTFCGSGCGAPPRRGALNAGPAQPKSSGPSPYVDIFSSVPGVAGNVRATAGDGTAHVTWAPALSDGSAITGYTVTSQPGGISTTVGAGATSATVTGLTDGTSYSFTVSASNGFGAGPTSASSNSVIPTGPATPTPTSSDNGTGNGGNGPTADAATPTPVPTSTADSSGTPVAQVAQPQQQSAPLSKPAPPPMTSLPIGLIIGLIVLLALIVGGGAAILISRSSRRSGTP